MTIAEFNSISKDTFNANELSLIEKHAGKMFRTDAIESYLPIGKKEVCLKRNSVMEKTIEVFLMNNTLEMNDALVTRFNKRTKNRAGS